MQEKETIPLVILSSIPEDLAESLAQQGSCEVNAVLIGVDINLKALTTRNLPRKEPILVRLGEKSLAMIYPYGALVFFNATTSSTVGLITRCQPFSTKLFTTPETEKFSVIIRPTEVEGIVNNKVSIKKI